MAFGGMITVSAFEEWERDGRGSHKAVDALRTLPVLTTLVNYIHVPANMPCHIREVAGTIPQELGVSK